MLGGPRLERWTHRRGAAGAVVPLEPVPCLVKIHTHVHSGTARYMNRCPCSGGVGCECEAGASRGGPLVRSRHKLRDGRPAAQSRPVQWSQAAEACSGVSSLLLFLGAKNVCFGAKSYVLEPNRTFWNHNVLCTNSVAIGDLFRLQCVQMCTDVPSGSDICPSAVEAALQASGRRGSIVGGQISFRDGSG